MADHLGSVLITGGTGSFGKAFAARLLADNRASRVIILSRDELKQSEMSADKRFQDDRVRFFIGDVRDRERLQRAFSDVQVVVHAAALKQIDACTYNPAEAVKTNVLGAMNVVNAAIDCGVQKVVALSTDKACAPTTLYGKSKACLEGLVCAAGAYSPGRTKFACVRYGNVWGSRGSVGPHFKRMILSGEQLTITHEAMTRFHMRLDQAAQFVADSLDAMWGGEVFIPKLPSYHITDLVTAFGVADYKITGIRPQEKMHEVMIGREESRAGFDCGRCYVLNPLGDYCMMPRAARLPEGFEYSSGTNERFLTPDELKGEIAQL